MGTCKNKDTGRLELIKVVKKELSKENLEVYNCKNGNIVKDWDFN